ncbi:imidazolonepropionase [Galbibacter sp.]|jgi:imidazolonepropionase|uniref:imidazolonepropionase n=1 Tax=Galbibacter sp. TaxID=2918471 RepID=UPI003A9094C4
MKILFTHIKELLQTRDNPTPILKGQAMKTLPSIKNAYLLIEDQKISQFGSMDSLPELEVDKKVELSGKMVLPTWCDSHTHLVYAGNREQEFIDRINGLSYEEIAQKGGGILNSAKTLENTSEDALFEQSLKRLEAVSHQGTAAIEIKSGYGLSLEGELKMLRVIQRLKKHSNVTIKSTFLGAHAVPLQYKDNQTAYIDYIIQHILPEVVSQQLAEYIDVFCEKGYFSVNDMERILEAATAKGLTPKVHVNQFNAIGGIASAVKYNALTVDHLEVIEKEDIIALQNSDTLAVALPLCSFFLGIPYTPARELINAGLPLVLASDYNPGSSPSGNMNQVVSTACIKMKLSPEEAINAATINAAHAMGVSATHGSITPGKMANFIVTKSVPSYGYLAYDFGNINIDTVYINGQALS